MKKHLTTPSRIVKNRKLGFRKKMSTSGGRAVIARRRRKGRKRLCL